MYNQGEVVQLAQDYLDDHGNERTPEAQVARRVIADAVGPPVDSGCTNFN